MEQQIVEDIETFDPSSFNDLIQTSPMSESMSSSADDTRIRYDINTSDTFYEINVEGVNMQLYRSDFTDEDLLNELQTVSPFGMEMNEMYDYLVQGLHPAENSGIDRLQSTDEKLAMNEPSNSSLPVIRPQVERLSIKGVETSIPLSQSVAITVPSPNQLQLVNALEDTYRPRYKSDYFPQNGNVRRPRYVADSAGNHFITLQMPGKHNRDLAHEYVRVAWLTTSLRDEGHFLSPYKFQVDHNNINVPDENPIYLPVKTIRQSNNTLRLHLVLIKSKLDQLRRVQPLQPFPDTGKNSNKQNPGKTGPKDLINKYQLDKSHLAFTLCTKRPDGSFEIHPETTITSSVMTEVPAKPSPTTLKSIESTMTTLIPAPQVQPPVSNQTVRCPNCDHCFDSRPAIVTTGVKKRKSSKGRGTSNSSLKSTTKSTTNRVGKRKKHV
jgi:hypothetical protein